LIASVAVGVGHAASFTIPGSVTLAFVPSVRRPVGLHPFGIWCPPSPSALQGVGHAANAVAVGRLIPPEFVRLVIA